MILVLGHRGQLGSALTQELFLQQKEYVSPDLDITNESAIREILHGDKIKTIINCAAFTNVDEAETDPRNWEVNAYAPAMIAEIAAWHRVRMIQISSDYVYGKEDTNPVINNTFPINAYGKAKMLADMAVYNASRMNTAIRVQNLCSEHKGLIKNLYMGSQLGVPPRLNVLASVGPTSVYLLAKGIVSMLSRPGVYNYAPETSVRLDDLYRHIAPSRPISIDTQDRRKAVRKTDNTMIPSQIFKNLGLIYPWQVHVKDIMDRIVVAKGDQ